jgi:hypothetical protein
MVHLDLSLTNFFRIKDPDDKGVRKSLSKPELSNFGGGTARTGTSSHHSILSHDVEMDGRWETEEGWLAMSVKRKYLILFCAF